jgi:hypothetical protein
MMNKRIKIALAVLAGVAMLSVVVSSGFATALVSPGHMVIQQHQKYLSQNFLTDERPSFITPFLNFQP